MLSLLLALLPLSSAQVVPTSPDSSTVVQVGQNINALWTVDTTGTWNDVEIQLMTGDNLNMIALETVATGIDGTTATAFSFAAPEVDPYSAIYFLQFTQAGNESTATWTTRFTIAGPDGSTVPPPNSTVYNGQTVEWGNGQLVGNSTTNGTSASTSAASTSHSGITVYNTGLPSTAVSPSVTQSGGGTPITAGASKSSGAAGSLTLGGEGVWSVVMDGGVWKGLVIGVLGMCAWFL